MSFDLQTAIRQVLSDGKETPYLFDRLLEKLENYNDAPVHSYIELRQRDDKTIKGFAWEEFCQWYLLNVKRYTKVYLWKEIPADIKEELNLTMRADNGIDIVAQRTEKSGFTAIQCKYKKRQIAKGRRTVKISWKTLSTFVGLCARTGPWDEHIVMTNCHGVGKWQIPRTSKDKTIAYGTFKNLTRTQLSPNAIVISDEKSTVKTDEEVRAARVARFTSFDNL